MENLCKMWYYIITEREVEETMKKIRKLTEHEKCIVGVLITMEIRSNETNRAYEIPSVFSDEELKELYEKVMGYKWEVGR